MAGQVLQTPLPKVQGSKFLLGPDLQGETMLVASLTNDNYPTGGYVITTAMCGLKMIQQAIVTGGNATAYPANSGWYAFPVFPETQLATNSQGFTGYSQFLLKVYVASTGVEVASNSGSLVNCIWQVLVLGY
jgi:hypothetical protein